MKIVLLVAVAFFPLLSFASSMTYDCTVQDPLFSRVVLKADLFGNLIEGEYAFKGDDNLQIPAQVIILEPNDVWRDSTASLIVMPKQLAGPDGVDFVLRIPPQGQATFQSSKWTQGRVQESQNSSATCSVR